MAEQEPELRIEAAGGLVAFQDVFNIAEAAEQGAIEALLVAGENGLGEEVMGLRGVGEPVEIGCEGLGAEVARDFGLKIEEFGEGFEGTGEQERMERRIVVVQEDLCEVNAGHDGVAAGGFDEPLGDLGVKVAMEVIGGKQEHGSAGGDDGEDGADESSGMEREHGGDMG